MTSLLVPYLTRLADSLDAMVDGNDTTATDESASNGDAASATVTPGASQAVVIQNITFSMPLSISAANVAVEVIDADDNVLWIGDVGGLATTVVSANIPVNIKGPIGKALTARFKNGVSGVKQKVSIVGRLA